MGAKPSGAVVGSVSAVIRRALIVVALVVAGATAAPAVEPVNAATADRAEVAPRNVGTPKISIKGKVFLAHLAGWFPVRAMPAPPAPATPPAPPPPAPAQVVAPTMYPTGWCDVIVPGMEGLAQPPGQAPPPFMEQIGTSVQGRPIWAEYWGPAQPSSTIIVIGQVHGNECAPLRFVRAIRANPPTRYGIWLIPTMNPDGHAAYTRENANGRDLNTDGWAQREPETRALMDFTARIRPVLSVHVHSPNGQVGWHGTGTYVHREPERSGAVLTGPITQYLADRSAFERIGAGVRSDRSRWFLWQGQATVLPGHEALLVEFHAVAPSEVPRARPRPPHRSVAEVDAEAMLVLEALGVFLP
jgi:murein peptide amidase A